MPRTVKSSVYAVTQPLSESRIRILPQASGKSSNGPADTRARIRGDGQFCRPFATTFAKLDHLRRSLHAWNGQIYVVKSTSDAAVARVKK